MTYTDPQGNRYALWGSIDEVARSGLPKGDVRMFKGDVRMFKGDVRMFKGRIEPVSSVEDLLDFSNTSSSYEEDDEDDDYESEDDEDPPPNTIF